MNYRKLFFKLFLLIPISLISQVNFNYEFSIPIINSNNSLIDIISADNNQNIVTGYTNSNEDYFRIAKYDIDGNFISSFEENYLDNEKLSYIYSSSEDNVPYLYLGFVNEFADEDTTIIKVKKIMLNNYTTVDSIMYIYDFFEYPSGLNREITVDIADMLIKEIDGTQFLYLGTIIDYHSDNGGGMGYEETDHIYSDLIIFQNVNNTYEFVEKLTHNGLSISSPGIIISSGFDKYHYLYNEPPIMTLVNEYNLYLYIQSNTNFPDNQVFHRYVGDSGAYPHIQILTIEDSSYQDYGTLIYYNDDVLPVFVNLSPDFNSILWENNYTTLSYPSQLTAFINIETNLGDHFVLYFFNDQIEIRDRIEGNIVHYETTDITPFLNLLIDNQKLFITQEQNEFNFYSIDDIIYLSADDNLTSPFLFKASNYPNPFNPSTTIKFSIENDSKIEILIYNTKGQKIKTVAHNKFTKGSHSIIWNGDDETGELVSSGVYLYKLNVNGKNKAVKKCLLLK